MYRVSTVRRSAPDGKGPSLASSQRAGLLSKFNSDERGNVAMSFGLMLTIMIGFIGASVDIGRWMLARKQTHDAMDAAVLAGLKAYQNNGQNVTAAQDAALTTYNFSVTQSGRGTVATNSLLLTDTVHFVITTDATGTTMRALGDASIKSPFIGAFVKSNGPAGSGQTFPALKMDETENSIGMVKTGQTSNIEISMMIDITGSMCESDQTINQGCGAKGVQKIDVVKAAALNLVQTVVSDTQSPYTSRVAIVPFSEAVNLGSAALGLAARGVALPGASTTPGSAEYDVVTGGGNNWGWGGSQSTPFYISSQCVTERIGSHSADDVSPITAPVGRFYSQYGKNNAGDGICPTATPVVPLTSNKTTLTATINSLTAGGSTAGHLGTAWAWYMLSPNFNTLWVNNAAGTYNDLTTTNSIGAPTLRKIAILMTDGEYNTEYCNGVSDWQISCNANNGSSNAQATALCNGMKAKQIEVYTIGAMVSSNAKSFLQSCATDANHYYDATNSTQLAAAFKDIATKLVPPVITH